MSNYEDNNKNISEEEILQQTKANKDITSIMLHVSILIEKEQYDDALEHLEKNPQAYKEDPLQYINTHLLIHLREHNYVEAIETLNKYKNKPYISMEVEEYLNDAGEEIKAHQSAYLRQLEKGKIPLEERLAYFEDADSLLNDLTYIAEAGLVSKYYEQIIEIPLHALSMAVRNYALLTLHESGYTNEVYFKDFHGNIRLIDLKEVRNPFKHITLSEVEEEFSQLSKDVTLNQFALQVFVLVTFNLYPDSLTFTRRSSLYVALLEVAASLIGHEGEITYLVDVSDALIDEVDELKQIITDYIGDPSPSTLN